MNESGEVIGVATMVTREGQNLGFAFAVEEVERALTGPTEGIETASESPPVDAVRPNRLESNRTRQPSGRSVK
jgi:S1-C subfamily serine protease